jgi:uncharacterized protein (UPF0261 family)
MADASGGAVEPVKFVIPVKGWSSVSIKGAELHEPEADAVFAPALRSHLKADMEVVEMETDFSSSEFANALVEGLEEMME